MLKNRVFLLLAPLLFFSGLLAREFWEKTHPSSRLLQSSPQPWMTPLGASSGSSPGICENFYHFICKKQGDGSDPTGSVRSDIQGEKIALSLYRDIILEHRNWSVEQIDEEMAKRTFNTKRRARLQSAFQWVKTQMIAFIEAQPSAVFTTSEKKQIQSRLQKTQLQIPPPASLYSDEPDLLTKNEIYYERTLDHRRKLRVGGAYVFIAKSWFNIVFTMAHELAHSIDPCELRAERLSFPAYDHLNACLIQAGIIDLRKDRFECGANDQLSETFADWMAVQITAVALQEASTRFQPHQLVDAIRNSVRDLCEQEEDTELFETDFHPPPQIRITQIFGAHPIIQSLLACPASAPVSSYCGFKTYTSENLTQPQLKGLRLYEK
ncbi:MAG: hypothetical protein ACO3A2_06795 [Bdellovibrionia bacterium]